MRGKSERMPGKSKSMRRTQVRAEFLGLSLSIARCPAVITHELEKKRRMKNRTAFPQRHHGDAGVEEKEAAFGLEREMKAGSRVDLEHHLLSLLRFLWP